MYVCLTCGRKLSFTCEDCLLLIRTGSLTFELYSVKTSVLMAKQMPTSVHGSSGRKVKCHRGLNSSLKEGRM